MRRLRPDDFAERFTACSRPLWCIAAAVAGRDQAQDVVQEAALIALGKLHQFDPATSFTAWMGRIVRFCGLNIARHSARRRTVPLEGRAFGESVADKPAPPKPPLTGRGELACDQASFDDSVLAALGTLGETARTCLLLRVVGELPYREIARVLDIPEGTAMSHVHRARRDLSDRLAEHVFVGSRRSGQAHG